MYKSDILEYVICIILCSIIAFITICLIFIYIKTKEMHSYAGYLNIIFCFVVLINNILRLIPSFDDDGSSNKNEDKHNGGITCKIQGFILALFDKLILVIMTIYSIITTFGMIRYESYHKKEKCLFITLILSGFGLSLLLAILFAINGINSFDDFCYVKQGDKVDKKLIDTIATSILFVINIYCNVRLLFFIRRLINEKKMSLTSDKKSIRNYSFYLKKYFLIFILNDLAFIIVILIIQDKFFEKDEHKSLSYIIINLLLIIFYAMNSRVLKEWKKLVCCEKEEQNSPLKEDEFDEDDEEYRKASATDE